MFKQLKLTAKMISGFIGISLIVLIVGIIGYQGINSMAEKSTDISERIPLIDAAMRMKLSVARDMQMIMEILATTNKEELSDIWKEHEEFVAEFDFNADGMLEGAKTSEVTIYATKNEKLRNIVSNADGFHNKEYGPRIKLLQDITFELFSLQQERESIMGLYEQEFEEFTSLLETLEVKISDKIQQKLKSGASAKQILSVENNWVDMVMELKSFIAHSRIAIEEYAQCSDIKSCMRIIQEFEEENKGIDGSIAALLNGTTTLEGTIAAVRGPILRAMIEDLATLNDNYQKNGADFIKLQNKILTNQENRGKVDLEADEIGTKMLEMMDQIVDGADGEIKTALKESAEIIQNSQFQTLIGVIIGFILAIVAGLFISRSITKPIAALVAVMQDIQDNSDFSKRVNSTSKDEVGDAANAFDGLLHSLEVAFGEVINVVKSVAAGEFSKRVEADVSGSLDQLKQGVNGTAESINETFSTLNNVMDALSDADYTRNIDISDLEGEYKSTVQTGLGSMKSSGTAIDAINNVMKTVANGEFDKRVEIKLPGDLGVLKDNINKSLQVVENGIEDTSRITVALSKGDLKPRVEANHPGQFGVLKNALNDTMNNIGDVVSSIAQAADVVASASNEIADGNADMSKRTEEQASSLEETASSMEELTSTVKQNADNAEQANQLAVGASQTADHGGSIVKQAVTAMAEINSSSSKIADIIGVIDEIAFQTNLLALNASVEAARAGEQGRGFAVVATEVRNLAQRSATAAKEIKELIQDSVGKVKVGSELVEKSGETLGDIVGGVKKVGDMIAEIAAASLQQTAGIGQVNQALANMDDITQRNAALAEEASANSENLSAQAQTMNQQVGFFDLGNKTFSAGRGATVTSSAASVKAIKPVAAAATTVKPSDDKWEEF